MGTGPDPAPRFVGNAIARLLTWLGPKGLEFGRYSLDYHNIRNWIYVNRHMGPQRAARHTPEYAKRAVAMYNQKGEIDALARCCAYVVKVSWRRSSRQACRA
jgi:7-hydroxymethyl chlorophyll a reductase